MPLSVSCPITQHYVRHHINTSTGQTYELKAFAEYCCRFSKRSHITDLNRKLVTSINFSYQLQQIIDRENEEHEKALVKIDEKGNPVESEVYENYDRALYLKVLEAFFDPRHPDIKFEMPNEDNQQKHMIELQSLNTSHQHIISSVNQSNDEAQPLIRSNRSTFMRTCLYKTGIATAPFAALLKGCSFGFFNSLVSANQYHLGYKQGKVAAQQALESTRIYSNINKPSNLWRMSSNSMFYIQVAETAFISCVEASAIYSIAYTAGKKRTLCYSSLLFMTMIFTCLFDITMALWNEFGSIKVGQWEGYETQWQASCKQLNISSNCEGNVTGPNQNDYIHPSFPAENFFASNGMLMFNTAFILLISICGTLHGYFSRYQQSSEAEILPLNRNLNEVVVNVHNTTEPRSSLRAR